MSRLPRIAALGGAALALAGSAFAADQIVRMAANPPASSVVTISSTAPLFNESGIVNGENFTRCTVLTNEGPQPGDVSLFGSSSQSALSPWLDLELVRGTLPAATPAGSCAGFQPDADDYGAGTPGVVYRGTLAALPDQNAGIADPTRWAVGEAHAYQLRVDYTGDNPQQGLTTVQNFSWGVTPFDDRPPVVDPVDPSSPYSTTPDPTTPDPTTQLDPQGELVATPGSYQGTNLAIPARQCAVITFPVRSYVGARAITDVRKVKQAAATGTTSTSSAPAPVISGTEQAHRTKLLALARTRSAIRQPTLVVRLSPGNGSKLKIRVGLRARGVMTYPKRWKWVRVRLNSTPAVGTMRYPFTATTKMSQLKVGYNQLDLTLNRGAKNDRVRGLPRLLRRSFGFIVGDAKAVDSTGDCTLG